MVDGTGGGSGGSGLEVVVNWGAFLMGDSTVVFAVAMACLLYIGEVLARLDRKELDEE